MKTATSKSGLYRGFNRGDDLIVDPDGLAKTAYLDGYEFGDRLLEGVPFTCTVLDDGSLQVSTHPSAAKYMAGLNEKKWLSQALEVAEQSDFFLEFPAGGDDMVLVPANKNNHSKHSFFPMIKKAQKLKTVRVMKTTVTSKPAKPAPRSVGLSPVPTTERNTRGTEDDPEYDDFLARVQKRFATVTLQGKEPLFTTNATDLFGAYLAAFPASQRQHYNCNACRHFIERFGNLVVIDEAGKISSPLWDEADAPAFYLPAIAALLKRVRRARVTGVFVPSKLVWGEPRTGEWRHFSVKFPVAALSRYNHPLLTAGQVMAEKKEDFKNVMLALEMFPKKIVTQALTLLETESLYRSEKVKGPAQWLLRLHEQREKAHGIHRANLIWKEVATAPSGFCHPRASMVGTLLEDLAAGLPFADVSRKFAAKMRPDLYQRPQAVPKAGNLAQAEKIVAQLGAAGALRRRFARLEEIEALWVPRTAKKTRGKSTKPAKDSVFGHLKAKDSAPTLPDLSMPAITMTWDKFQRTVLPTAEFIEYRTTSAPDGFAALLTAVEEDAPPILQWDTEERRNPVSWYVYVGGSPASQWGLPAPAWIPVDAVTLKPSMWGAALNLHAHQGEGVVFILRGAQDTRNTGIGLFPEILRSEYREIRSSLEAYSRNATLEGREEASACGLMLHKGADWRSNQFRVTTAGRIVTYSLDRWD